MEFTIDRETFLGGIQKTLGVVERQTSMPILQNLLIRIKPDDARIEIAATDRELGLLTSYEASIIKPGEITVSARKLYETVRELQGESLHFVSEGKKGSVAVLTSNKAVCRLNGMSAKDFPVMIGWGEHPSFPMRPALLREMIRKTLFAVCRDEARKNITGVFLRRSIHLDKGAVQLIATDGHRLAIAKAEVTEPALAIPEQGVIIPRKGMVEIGKIAAGTEEDVRIGFAVGACIIEAGETALRVSLIEGAFPDHERILPDEAAEGAISVSVDRDAILHSLRRMSVYSPDRVVLEIGKDTMRLEAEEPDTGEIKDEIGAECSGEERTVKFNIRYLLDAIEAVSDARVVLSIPQGNRGCLIRGADDQNYLCVVMPLAN